MSDLFVAPIGTGPALLMMHGVGLDHTYLRPWHDDLASSHRLVYYDHRGCGRNLHHAEPLDHAVWHADAAAVLDASGEQRAIVYGHSYGAWLALGFALRYPDRVAGLILCGASPAFDYIPEVIANAQARDPAAAKVLVEGLGAPVVEDDALARLWSALLPLYFHGRPRPDILARTQFSAHAFDRSMACLQGFTVEPELPDIAVPILVLAGRDDYITPPSQAHRIAARARSATVVELTASGHFPFVEENERYLAAIRAWLS